MINSFFITGYLRSGTTLLEKFWHNHPQVVVASQPFPFLYYEFKKAFYNQLGVAAPQYPLGTLFGESTYRRAHFSAFLGQYRMTAGAVAAVMTQMQGYSGQMTPQLLDMPVVGGSLAEIYRNYAQQYFRLLEKPAAVYAGSKEVFCEEFIPYFLQEGIPVFLIIRDPRAVVASIHGGRGSTYASSALSVLQIARSWRKSVAFAIAHFDHPLFHWVRYEQLEHDAGAVLQPLAKALRLDGFPDPVIAGELYSQDGNKWLGNSSFEQPKMPRPRYRQVLDRLTTEFLNVVCGPEMDWLGIARTSPDMDRAITEFHDLYQPGHPQLAAEDCLAELTRLRKLTGDPFARSDGPEDEALFLFPNVRSVLSHAVQGENK